MFTNIRNDATLNLIQWQVQYLGNSAK